MHTYINYRIYKSVKISYIAFSSLSKIKVLFPYFLLPK